MSDLLLAPHAPVATPPNSRHPHALLMFRVGRFLQLFFEDAVLDARELRNHSTPQKEKGPPSPPMPSPHHSAQPTSPDSSKKATDRICEQSTIPNKPRPGPREVKDR